MNAIDLEACRKHGAFIITAHEHSYERTHLLSNFETQEIESKSSTLKLRPGASFVAVSGLGGQSFRPWWDDKNKNPWWAATAALDNGVNYGALLCTFRYKGDPYTAKCVMKDIDGTRWDKFKITVPPPNAPQARSRNYQMVLKQDTSPQSHFIETAIVTAEDIITIDARDGSRLHGSQILEFSHVKPVPITHQLTFKVDIRRARGQAITGAHLQVMGSHPFPNTLNMTKEQVKHEFSRHQITLYITGIEDDGRESTSEVEWTSDEFEVGEVWVSPDISSILSKHTIESDFMHITIGLRGKIDLAGQYNPIMTDTQGKRGVYGTHDKLSTCVSPTLVIITK